MIIAAAATAAKAAAATAAKGAKPLQVHLTPQQLQQLQAKAAAQPAVAPAAPMPMTWFQQHLGWLTHGLAGIFIIAAIALVVLLAVQTTKQEGLSGTLGGRVESSYARMGADQQLQRITGFTAVLFVVTGFILSLTGI